MSDYKYEMQLLAEQRAEEVYGKDFSELPSDVQDRLFTGASEAWIDNKHAQAESLEDR
jgi:hypothetical protein